LIVKDLVEITIWKILNPERWLEGCSWPVGGGGGEDRYLV